MNIQTVAENLRATIAGKQQMLTEYTEAANHWEGTGHIVFSTMRDMLVINIDELRRILQDVEQCEPSLLGEGNNYEKWDGDE